MPAPTEERPSIFLPLVGFLVVFGGFGAGLFSSLRHNAPAETVTTEPAEPPPEEMMKVYYPFPEDIYITRPDGTMVIVSASFYLEGAPATLLHLQEVAKERQAELQAQLLAAAQTQAEASPDIPAYRAALPDALKGTVNAMLGDEALPDPVKEVLLTQFVSR